VLIAGTSLLRGFAANVLQDRRGRKPLTPGPPTHGHAESNFLSVKGVFFMVKGLIGKLAGFAAAGVIAAILGGKAVPARAAMVSIDSGAKVMAAVYGDYYATAVADLNNVSNFGFMVNSDPSDTNMYSAVFFKGDNPVGYVDRNESLSSLIGGYVDVDFTTSIPGDNPYELVKGEALNPDTMWGLYDKNNDGDFGYYTDDGGVTHLFFDEFEFTNDSAAFDFSGALPYFTGSGMSGSIPPLDFNTSLAIPEPSTISLLALGGLAGVLKRRRK